MENLIQLWIFILFVSIIAFVVIQIKERFKYRVKNPIFKKTDTTQKSFKEIKDKMQLINNSERKLHHTKELLKSVNSIKETNADLLSDLALKIQRNNIHEQILSDGFFTSILEQTKAELKSKIVLYESVIKETKESLID